MAASSFSSTPRKTHQLYYRPQAAIMDLPDPADQAKAAEKRNIINAVDRIYITPRIHQRHHRCCHGRARSRP
ncbi:hypothetical protein ACLOJK_023796, partial [Asimina triloba]